MVVNVAKDVSAGETRCGVPIELNKQDLISSRVRQPF